MTKSHLYPLYIVKDSTGRPLVQCVDLQVAREFAGKRNGTIELEPRKLEDEKRLPSARRAEIDAIYEAGV